LSGSVCSELQVRELKTAKVIGSDFRGNVRKNLTGRRCVSADTVDAALSNLHTGRCQFDKALHEPTFNRLRTGHAPQAFPFFMSFPVETQVEVIESQQIGSVF
jgi:hypothetical protein